MITIKTLLSFSSEKVARYIDEGHLLNTDYALNEKLSNLVYRQLSENFALTRKTNEEITKKFNCTCIDVPEDVYDYTLNMLQSQNFKEISIPHESSYTVMRAGRTIYMMKTPMDVIKKMLNEESQKNLKMLTLCGSGLEYPMGWMGKLSSLLPSLTSLAIPHCQLLQSEFVVLCKRFKNLQTLDISGSGVKNLNGISNLEHLEILNLNAIPFRMKDDIRDLFNLKKLKVLDISGEPERKVYNLNHIVNNDKVLPALKYLDCSFNKTDKFIFAKFFLAHKTIEKICIVGTRIPYKPVLLKGIISVLSCQDLKSCLSSLYHYSKFKLTRYPTTDMIYEKIERFLNYDQDERDLQKCNALLLSIAKARYDDRLTMTGVMSCMQLWFSKHGVDSLCDQYKNASMHIFYTLITQDFMVDPDKTQLTILFHTWAVLTTPGLFDNASPEIIDRYCLNIAQKIARRTAIVANCLRFLSIHIQRMTPVNFNKLANDANMRTGLMKLMRTANHYKMWEISFDIYCVLRNHGELRKDQKQDEYEIRVLMISLNRLTAHPDIQIPILDYLEELLDKLHLKSFHQFFHMDEFQIATLLFCSEHTEIIKRTVSLFVKIWFLKNPRGRQHPFIYDKEKNERLIKTIIKTWRNFPKTDHVDQDLAIYLTVKMSKTDPDAHRLKFWANWVLWTHMDYRRKWYNNRRYRVVDQ